MQTFEPKIPIAAITDEFSPDLDTALAVMQEIGMTAAELRVIGGKNILDLTDEELDRVVALKVLKHQHGDAANRLLNGATTWQKRSCCGESTT